MNPEWQKYIDKRNQTQKTFLDLFFSYFQNPDNLLDAYEFAPNNIYHSVSFSNHENYTELYETERNGATSYVRNLGWEIWAPYEKTDPGKLLKRFDKNTQTNHGHSAAEILDIDFTRILRSEVLLLDYNLSSNGVGQEAQVAFFVPKIVYTRKRPTMLTGGLPGTLPIFYDNFDSLKKILKDIFQRDSYDSAPFYVKDDQVYKGDENLNEKFNEYLWKWN